LSFQTECRTRQTARYLLKERGQPGQRSVRKIVSERRNLTDTHLHPILVLQRKKPRGKNAAYPQPIPQRCSVQSSPFDIPETV
jgi:hypothetical protein